MGRRPLLSAMALATFLVAGCGGPNGPGQVITPPPPQLTCASAITVDDVTSGPQTVNYAAPTVTGGALPVTVACSPASGTTFPLGATTVTCNASDSQVRTASCSFTVTLRNREFAVTKILAFGDSMTLGENGRPLDFTPFVDAPNAYPTFLQSYFNDRAPGQQITVVNAGVSGEKAADSIERLKEAIGRHQPQVLLYLQGINDLNGGATSGAVRDAIRDAIRTASDRGVKYVFVSTILPVARDVCTYPNPPVPLCRAEFTPAGQPAQADALIRSMVPAANGHLVDPYDAFVANRAAYIDTDGLHLRPAGNQALASAFWDRIIAVIPARQLTGSDFPIR